MIKVKNILGDDIFGLWHIKQIIVHKDGERFSFAPDNETFPTKEEAERQAHHRARYFIQRKLGFGESGHPSKQKGLLAKAIKPIWNLFQKSDEIEGAPIK